MCPLLWDILDFPTELVYAAPGAPQVYFNRTDVKTAIHAPQSHDWSACQTGVFTGGDSGPEGEGDTSLDPIQKVLPQVIEATNRVLVSNGDYGKYHEVRSAAMLDNDFDRYDYHHERYSPFHLKHDLEWSTRFSE